MHVLVLSSETPDALTALEGLVADAAGFHPKLWLVRSASTVSVLSGSGNLTQGGLVSNVEQFELSEHQRGSPESDENERRFMSLTSAARPLEEFEKSPAWFEWSDQLRKREEIARRLHELDAVLASRKAGGRDQDKRLLCDDLLTLHDEIVAARLPGSAGRAYRPTRFKQALDKACAANNPVPFVANFCRRTTEGFDVIAAAGASGLAVEALVVDASKPYHDLFDTSTVETSARRLEQLAQ